MVLWEYNVQGVDRPINILGVYRPGSISSNALGVDRPNKWEYIGQGVDRLVITHTYIELSKGHTQRTNKTNHRN